jgi:hypothetical protein
MLKTHMVLRRERILKRIEMLKEMIQVSEEELEELEDVIRIKGPYKPQRSSRRVHSELTRYD